MRLKLGFQQTTHRSGNNLGSPCRCGICRVRRLRQHAANVGRGLRGFHLRQALEIGACHGVELERKHRVFEARQGIGNVVDGVIGHRQRTVPAGVGGLQLEIRVELLGGRHLDVERPAALGGDTAESGLSAKSASTRPRCCFSSQFTPLEVPPSYWRSTRG